MSSAGGIAVTVTGAQLVAAHKAALAGLVDDGVPTALATKDPTLWGPHARDEASIRLGWLDAPAASRELLTRLEALREQLTAEGLDHIVLAGMGGSSLAPEVICNTAGVALTVLDTTDPGQVRAALADRLDRTLVVVSSKSGGTIETDSHRRAYTQAFRDAGVADPGRRFVTVTDPGSPLEETARAEGFREVFLADPNVGGRYSALTAFGLVPSALAGVDVTALLDDAAALTPVLACDVDNPALELGAVLGGAGDEGLDKLVLADAGSGIAGFGDWAEQLVAESTGKQGNGLLPVVVGDLKAPGADPGGDRHLVVLGRAADLGDPHTGVTGPLGAQFLAWEYATAVAGRVMGIDPFDQPNVTESKENTARILSAGLPEESPVLVDGAVEIYADPRIVGDTQGVSGLLDALLDAIPDRGYLAVMAYLDRHADSAAAGLRDALAARTGRPVTFGWGPRFLHSTGQYHKGGPPVGAFLQVTGAVAQDLPIPGREYTFGTLQAAQAAGDREALAQRDRPLVHLHLTDRAEGLRQLLQAAR
ncbi:MAG: glucose-6-phosphate isomerase [Pseudonocardiales bacterium]|nr:MAG: glucose-6-phosphate isomerase [Pseudonocardiales bacterium]